MDCNGLDNTHSGNSAAYFAPFHCPAEKHASPGMVYQGSPESRHSMDCSHFHAQWMPGGFVSQRGAESPQANVNHFRQECPAMSMTMQPFIPKEVMDIARPMPAVSKSQQNVKREQTMATPATCRCGCCNDPCPQAYSNENPCFMSMESRPNENRQPSGGFRTQPANVHTLKSCCNGEAIGNMPENDYQPMGMSRSRSQWRNSDLQANNTFNKTVQCSAAPAMKTNSMMQHQVYQMPNQSGHCHCMNPSCPMHAQQQPMMNTGYFTMEGSPNMNGMYQRSRSYEVLDGMTNGFSQMSVNPMQLNVTKKKASLPPASHHSPEQRTSYREHSRS